MNKLKQLYENIKKTEKTEKTLETLTLYDCIKFIPSITSGRVLRVNSGNKITIGCKLPEYANKYYKFEILIRGVCCPKVEDNNLSTVVQVGKYVRDKVSNKLLNEIVIFENVESMKNECYMADVYLNIENISQWLILNHYGVPYDERIKLCEMNWNEYINEQN